MAFIFSVGSTEQVLALRNIPSNRRAQARQKEPGKKKTPKSRVLLSILLMGCQDELSSSATSLLLSLKDIFSQLILIFGGRSTVVPIYAGLGAPQTADEEAQYQQAGLRGKESLSPCHSACLSQISSSGPGLLQAC